MKIYLFSLILLMVGIDDINKIAKSNRLKKEAEKAYLNENYALAIQKYHQLVDSMGVQDDQIILNMGNAYYRTKDTASASNYYRNLIFSDDNETKSVAHQQLGVIAHQSQKLKEALAHFKEALKANPANEEARYNYELLKKLIDQQQQQQNQQNQDQQQDQEQQQDQQDQQDQQQQQQQQNQDQQQQQEEQQQSQEQQQQEQEQQQSEQAQEQEGDPQEQETSESQQENTEQQEDEMQQMPQFNEEDINISKEKARMILEAMRNNEIQYLQQMRKKGAKKQNNNKPDW